MANILDYLDWRGDVPFSLSPFNDVDNLVLSQSSYTLLDGILDEDGITTAKEASEAFFSLFNRKEVEEDRMLHKRAPFILEKLGSSQRFSDMKVAYYTNRIDTKGTAQMSAVSFLFPDFVYVAYRGTDNTLVGWKEDFNMSYMPVTEGQEMALCYLNSHFSGYDGNIMVGGHSKGGNFAVYSSAFANPDIREHITRVFSNDGPGFIDEILSSKEYAEVLPKVTSIIPESTLVGALFGGRYDHKVVKSTVEGLKQHDPTTWLVLRDSLVEAEGRSDKSIRMDEAVSSWLCGLSDEDRRFFTDVLFELLESNGATRVEDLSDGILANIGDVMKTARSLPRDKRREFNGMLKNLIKSIRKSNS